MKRVLVLMCVLGVVAWVGAALAEEAAKPMEEAPAETAPMEEAAAPEEMAPAAEPFFGVGRLVVATGVEEREPVGVAETFEASVVRVACFLEATDVREDTTAAFVWYHEGEEISRVDLPLGQSPRWRTYSTKKLGDRSGAWKVEVRDASDAVVGSVSFTVQ
jgi:hypothetical protein